jgi:L-alanine-DL-glutamate epimerase-like enolase superfamily enzyme
MKIVKILEKSIPIKSNMRNAYINFSEMTASIVAVVTDVKRNGQNVIGYGFNSNGRYAAGCLMRERFIPRIMRADPAALLNDEQTNFDPSRIWNIMMTNEKPGGHGERCVAVGTIDMALWDAVAKIEDKPLYQVLAEKYGDGQPAARVFVYAAGGYYQPDKGVEVLQNEMRGYLAAGYTTVKMKIGSAPLEEDIRRIEAVLEVVGDGQYLAVDANGRFDLETALAYAEALQPYNLYWYEEAGDPLDYALQAEVAHHYDQRLATGENLFSVQDVRNLLRYGGLRPGLDVLQMDCALSYGLVEYLRILTLLKEFGWSGRNCIPHGGHQMTLNIAAGLGLGGNESYPDVFIPFGGFADGFPIENGYIGLPDIPGIGFEQKSNVYRLFKDLAH